MIEAVTIATQTRKMNKLPDDKILELENDVNILITKYANKNLSIYEIGFAIVQTVSTVTYFCAPNDDVAKQIDLQKNHGLNDAY